MKKILLLATWLIYSSVSFSQTDNEGQMLFVQQSFKDDNGTIANGFVLTKGESWPMDIQGEHKAALIRITVEQMPNSEAKNLSFNVDGKNVGVSETDFQYLESHKQIDVYVSPKEGMRLRAIHPTYGYAYFNIPKALKEQGVYLITLRNNRTENISIKTIPDGATVVLNGKKLSGRTPLQLEGIPHGLMKIQIGIDGRNVINETIEVSSTNTHFEFDLRQKKLVEFDSDPTGADLKIMESSKVITMAKTPIELDLPYGSYTAIGSLNGISDTLSFNVDALTGKKILYIEKKKPVEFYANYEGKRVNAYIDLKRTDGNYTLDPEIKKHSYNSFRLNLPYGTYKARLSAMGNYKERTIKINKSSDSRYEFAIKPKNEIVWPWQRDYQSVPIGITMGYVQKQLSTSGNGEKYKENGVWDDGENKWLSGIQLGFLVQPCLSFGLGFRTGAFYEYYFSSNDNYDYTKFEEHNIYVPVHALFRLPFGRKFAFTIHGGLGFNYAVSGAYKADGYEDISDFYGESAYPKRFNMAAEVGLGMRLGPIQIDGQYSGGITNHHSYDSLGDGYKTVQNKLSLTISIVFGSSN